MKQDCWSNAKLSHENETYLHDKNYMYEDEMFDEVITRVLRMRLQFFERIYAENDEE